MSDQIRQEDINAAAWEACDTFRGVMDAAGYKDYILVMLFLKYISDVWQDHYDEYRKKYGNNEKRIQRKLQFERFILPEDSSFYALYARRAEAKIGDLINTALKAIETKNKELEGVFRNIDFNSEANLGNTRERNRCLKTLLEVFGKPALNMRPSRVSEDVIGNTYIYLIERFASDAGKKAGEFYTPHKVSELVAKLCAPKPGTRICDPACGSAGLLVEAAREVGGRDYSLYGMEVNGGTWALARMNMFLHSSFGTAHIERCNTLTDPALVEADKLMKFHSVVANPPFSLKKWGAQDAETDPYRRFWRGLPPKTKGDYAFISHMIEAAVEKEGRIVVVVPLGVLFRGGAEGAIRRQLIEENLLDAVIGLPGKLFPTTSIKVAILVFDRSREKGGKKYRRKNVLFIDASKDYEAGANQNKLLESHLKKILKTYKARRDVEKYAHVANIEKIRENRFRLNVPLYVDTVEEWEEIDVDAVEKDIRQLEKELSETRGEMRKLLKGIKR